MNRDLLNDRVRAEDSHIIHRHSQHHQHRHHQERAAVADRQHHQAEEREIDMRYSTKINIICSVIAVFATSGCYTQLMSPQDYLKIRKQPSSTSIANNAYSINYNQSCTSCHSVAELNERAEELESYGIWTVHEGVLLSNRQWLNENPDEILYGDPGPIYWPTPIYPTNPWWVPPVTVVTTPATTTPTKGNRPRTDGPTRDNNPVVVRDRPIPVPTTAQPPVTTGGTTPTPVPPTPAPAVTITPAPSSTPVSQPTENGRTRDTNSSGGATSTTKTRSDGSSRDTSGDRPR
jgi:hypothetical protein